VPQRQDPFGELAKGVVQRTQLRVPWDDRKLGGQVWVSETDFTAGVLQRIGLVYLIASLIVLGLKVRGQAIVAAVILVGYALLLYYTPTPGEPEQNLIDVTFSVSTFKPLG